MKYGYGYSEKIKNEIKRRKKEKLSTKELEEVFKPKTIIKYHSPMLKNRKRIHIYRNEIDEFVIIKVNGKVKLSGYEIDDMITSLKRASDDILSRERKLLGIVYKIEDENND